jgi:hypothetical protein
MGSATRNYTIPLSNFSQQEMIDYFFGAVYSSNYEKVNMLLDTSKISVYYDDYDINCQFYSILTSIMMELHESINQGDENSILVYDRVAKYFNLNQ